MEVKRMVIEYDYGKFIKESSDKDMIVKSYSTWVNEFYIEGKRITRIALEAENGFVFYINE